MQWTLHFSHTHTHTHTPHTHTQVLMASIGDTIILHMFTHHENGDTRLTCDDLSWPQLTCKLSDSSDFLQGNWQHYPHGQMGSFNTPYSSSYNVYSPY